MKLTKWMTLGLAALIAPMCLAELATQTYRNQNSTGQTMAADIAVLVDNQPVTFAGQQPIMKADRVLVPLRGVFEQMNATVTWQPEQNMVIATREGKTIKLPIGQNTAWVDGQAITLDQPAILMNGRALVPLRFLSETLGCTVDWRSSTMTVTINSAASNASMRTPKPPKL